MPYDLLSRLRLEVKISRYLLRLTQYELAELAEVTHNDIELLEQGAPVVLDTKRKILKTLWALKFNYNTKIHDRHLTYTKSNVA